MSNTDCCVIIGAGHAAAQLAFSLRQEGWAGRIVMVGDESRPPYHRPPLSKAFLLGAKKADELALRPASMYEKQGIELRLAAGVEKIDRAQRVVELRGGERLHWNKLAICTGAAPRRISVPGSDLASIHYLRTLDDAAGIQAQAVAGQRAVIVGGGYIGLEAAAALRGLGLSVTVLEMAPRLLARVTAAPLSGFYERIHREEGVHIATGSAVSRFEGRERIEAVVCEDGTRHEADLVIVGIGVMPNTALAQAAGLEVNDGIVVDACARTSDPDIVAAGDCTRFPCESLGRLIRLESVPNANEQAKSAAAAICGKDKPSVALPWFWSDQFDLKLQIAGLNTDHDQVVVRGDPAVGRSFAAFYLKGGVVIAADCVNRPQDFLASKRLIEARCQAPAHSLADEGVPLASLLPQ